MIEIRERVQIGEKRAIAKAWAVHASAVTKSVHEFTTCLVFGDAVVTLRTPICDLFGVLRTPS